MSEINFPRRHRELELKEPKKSISYKKIPETTDDLKDARTVRNEELPETLQSEAFHVAFSDFNVIDKRKTVF